MNLCRKRVRDIGKQFHEHQKPPRKLGQLCYVKNICVRLIRCLYNRGCEPKKSRDQGQHKPTGRKSSNSVSPAQKTTECLEFPSDRGQPKSFRTVCRSPAPTSMTIPKTVPAYLRIKSKAWYYF